MPNAETTLAEHKFTASAARPGAVKLQLAAETVRLYAGNWAHFQTYCVGYGATALPASSELVTAFLTAPGSGRAVLARRLACARLLGLVCAPGPRVRPGAEGVLLDPVEIETPRDDPGPGRCRLKVSASHRAQGDYLGQGFPDTDGPADILQAAADALFDGRNQDPTMAGVPELRQELLPPTPASTATISTRRPRSSLPPALPKPSPPASWRATRSTT